MGLERTGKKYVATSFVLVVALVLGAFVATNSFPPVSNSVKKNWTGICVHTLSANDARLVSESGVGWIRIDVSPDFGEAVANAKAYNLSVLGILDSWMFDQRTTFTLEEWRTNVTFYVSQYAESVEAWEIWNEPANPNLSWTLLNLSICENGVIVQQNMKRLVDFYFSMVQEASEIIRQYDPSAKIVLFGGLSLWSGGDWHRMLDMEFVNQLAARDIQRYGDAISVHAYPCMEPVEPWIWEKYNETLQFYHGVFDSNKSLEVWVTETGYPADSGEGSQELYMINALGYFDGKAAKLFWYSLLDNLYEEKFGLIGNEKPRLAYYALQKQLISKND